ncbi:tRNA 2'-phosphotransferase 1 isoform X2 [Pygocentrus nattereri]|uniref:tRNA 2'-phosphotransferase 1 isoform X2 n=1 Tax=Pygocentrus nattereri TaxID=42514 RepID=UPI00081498CC|nr:tRNA 2'-phosphotransferase 1 isoform X2 [Pygocentrus nattereri]
MDGQHGGRGKRGRGGRGNRGESRDVRLSKSLSYALRHGASKMGLHMSSDGFIFVDELLAHPQFSSFSLEDLERVVAMNDKQRFKLQNHPENGRLQIRANQGHTVQVEDLELRAVVPDASDCPQEAVHGSYMRHWASIRSKGMRQNCDLAVYVDVPKALSDGIKFYWSENGVLLTPGDADGLLAPQYFSHAQRLKPSPCELELQ